MMVDIFSVFPHEQDIYSQNRFQKPSLQIN